MFSKKRRKRTSFREQKGGAKKLKLCPALRDQQGSSKRGNVVFQIFVAPALQVQHKQKKGAQKICFKEGAKRKLKRGAKIHLHKRKKER